MEVHVLLADRHDEVARRRESLQVARIVVDPPRDPSFWIAGFADRLQQGAVVLIVASAAARTRPRKVNGMHRRLRRRERPAAGAACRANALLVVFGMIFEPRGQLRFEVEGLLPRHTLGERQALGAGVVAMIAAADPLFGRPGAIADRKPRDLAPTDVRPHPLDDFPKSRASAAPLFLYVFS